MKTRKTKPATERHLWSVTVRHRDWKATMNNFRQEERFTTSTLFIEVRQPVKTAPIIERGLSATNAFLAKNQRLYKYAVIEGITHNGTIDN